MSDLSMSHVAADLSSSELSAIPRTPLLFLTIATALVVVGFMTPLGHSWYRPSYDETEDAERAETGAEEGSIERQVTLGALGVFGIVGLAATTVNWRRPYGPLAVICVVYLLWCGASCLWSENLAMSTRRVVALGCEIIAALVIAQRASARQFAWLVFACSIAWLALGVLAEISQGTLDPWLPDYRFKGVFHPNITSASCALLAMSSLYLASGPTALQGPLAIIGATALGFLVLTGSRTGLAAAIIAYGSVWLLSVGARRPATLGWIAFALACALAAGMLGVFQFSADLLAMGRPDNDVGTLSSRLPLWRELLSMYWSNAPLLGYGYGAFWTPEHLTDVADAVGWGPAYAHSTYIDLLLSTGLVGAALAVCGQLLALWKAVGLEIRYPHRGFGFSAMVIAFVLADGILETTFGSTCFMSFFGICGVCIVLCSDDAGQLSSPSSSAYDIEVRLGNSPC
jgi:O-antigen ligase